MRYNAIYAKGMGPSRILVADSGPPFSDIDLEPVISSATFSKQPSEKKGDNCTALLGSPGPLNMEFVSVPCDVTHSISGVICMSVADKLDNSKKITYALHHVRSTPDASLPSVSSVLGSNVTYFNTDRFNLSVLYANNNRRNLTEKFESGSLTEDEVLSKKYYEVYMKALEELRISHNISWMEVSGHCTGNSSLWMYGSTSSIPCKAFMNSTFQVLEKTVSILETVKPVSKSVHLKDGILMGQFHCEKSWLLFNKECFKVAQTGHPPLRESGDLNVTCQRFKGASYVVTSSPKDELVNSILKTFSVTSAREAFNDSDNCTSIFRDGTGLYQSCSNGTTGLALCAAPVTETNCLKSCFNCSNGEWIIDRYWCDGKLDCPGGEDEQDCKWICSAAFQTSAGFCRESCHSDNCTCSQLLFQCHVGGCIHSAQLCDGAVDCRDGEDEEICRQNVACSSMKNAPGPPPTPQISHIAVSEITCDVELELPCPGGSPACYPIAKCCLFERDREGELIHYCSNAKHLADCEDMECTGTYKCRHSYCIPTSNVCDGVTDCPYGDDEGFCPLIACPSLLRCETGSCIHPLDICDGINQCPSGKDEQQCQTPLCPPGCQCLGFAVVCLEVELPLASHFSDSKIRILRVSKAPETSIPVVIEIIRTQQSLFVLNLSDNEIPLLSEVRIFAHLSCLQQLDVSNNKLTVLVRGMFSGLSYLQKLSLSRNPIAYIDSGAFDELTHLRYLLLSHTSISSLSINVFGRSQKLDLLDISHSTMKEILTSCPLNVTVKLFNVTGNSLSNIDEPHCLQGFSIVSDQKELCCLRDLLPKCHVISQPPKTKCRRLLHVFAVTSLLTTLSIILCIVNVIVLIYHINEKSKVSSLDSNLAISNLLVAEPLLVAVVWDSSYGPEVTFFEQTLVDSMICKTAWSFMLMTSQISSSFLLSASWIKYVGTVKTELAGGLSPKNNSLFAVTALIWLTWTGLTVACHHIKGKSGKLLSCLTSHVSSNVIHFRLICVAYDVVCCLMTAVFYAGILRKASQMRNVAIGRRHGRDIYKTVSCRLYVTIICTLLIRLSSAALMVMIIVSPAENTRLLSTVWLVGLSPLPALSSPFLYTFSSRKFTQYLIGMCRGTSRRTR